MDQAEHDFNYFWKEHRKYKGVNETPQNSLEVKLDRLTKKLERSREKVHEAEREYGEKSWHVKHTMVDHLTNMRNYISAESEHMRQLMEKFPEHKDLLTPQIKNLEEEFKKTTKRIQIVKDSL